MFIGSFGELTRGVDKLHMSSLKLRTDSSIELFSGDSRLSHDFGISMFPFSYLTLSVPSTYWSFQSTLAGLFRELSGYQIPIFAGRDAGMG